MPTPVDPPFPSLAPLSSSCLPLTHSSECVYSLGSKQIRHTSLKYDQAPPCSIKAKQGNPS